MDKIKLFWAYNTGPDVTSSSLMFFNNLLSELRKKTAVEIIWFVYQPEKHLVTKNIDGFKVIYMQDFDNGLDVISEEKPDVVFATADEDIPSYTFALSAKSLNIPVVSFVFNDYGHGRSLSTLWKSYATRFFEKSIPTDTSEKKPQFMRRGRFFVKKYFFLLKTQRALRINPLKIFKSFFIILSVFLKETGAYTVDSRFANNLHFLESEDVIEPFLKGGFEKSTLLVTGNPQYDIVFQKSFQMKDEKKEGKLRVLFAPNTLYETGFWTRSQRDMIVAEIIKQIIQKKNKISLVVKIHPSTAILSDYEQLIHTIDPTIPIYQKGDITPFLEQCDVLISSESGSGERCALIFRKPIVSCNFLKEVRRNLLVEGGLAVECTDPSKLNETIETVAAQNPITEDNRRKFIEKYFYRDDGLAAARIADALISFVENWKKKTEKQIN